MPFSASSLPSDDSSTGQFPLADSLSVTGAIPTIADRSSTNFRVAVVPPELAGNRLDVIIARLFPDLSRSQAQRLIETGDVLLAGRSAKSSDRPRLAEEILLTQPSPTTTQLVPTPMDLKVVYEDDDLLVIDKPAGLVVHPGAGHTDDTLANGLLARLPDLTVGGELRPGIVHRLDRDTSGLLVVAKNDGAFRNLAAQLQAHEMRKEYLALVHGTPRSTIGVIDAPIGRDPRDRKRMAIVATGRPARTHFVVAEQLGCYSLLEIRLETGRTHQIRVHFASLGHPVVGDSVYGRQHETLPIARQFLHARRLGFRLPSSNEPLLFESPIPLDLSRVLEHLKAGRGSLG